ncbi:MAG: hypothetical protein R2706_10895 [Acidimicrobiales bacterium]
MYDSLDTDNSPVAAVGRWLEREVITSTYGIDSAEFDRQYLGFSASTVWRVLVHHRSASPVAAMRCLVGPGENFQFTRHVFQDYGLNWDDACGLLGLDPHAQYVEGCTFSILPEWRNADRMWPVKVTTALYLHLVEDCEATAAVQLINPLVRRVFAQWGVPFESIAPPLAAPEFGGAVFDPTFSITTPGNTWFHTTDAEFYALTRERSTAGRGGTRLPPLDLDRGSLAVQLNRKLYAERGRPVPVSRCPER